MSLTPRYAEAHDKLEALFGEYPDVFGPGDGDLNRIGDWILITDWHDLENPDTSFYTYSLERHMHVHSATGLLYHGLGMLAFRPVREE